jgi:hypothetical protein
MHKPEGAGTELERAGISVERDDWGDTTHTGTREAMIAAGLLAPEQVPGDPTCPRTHVFRFERAGRWHTASLFRHRTLVKLHVGLTREEVDAEQARDAVRCVAEDARFRGAVIDDVLRARAQALWLIAKVQHESATPVELTRAAIALALDWGALPENERADLARAVAARRAWWWKSSSSQAAAHRAPFERFRGARLLILWRPCGNGGARPPADDDDDDD